MDIRLVDVEGIEDGMLAADDIIGFDGAIIAKKGTEIEGRHIRLFKRAVMHQVRVMVPEKKVQKETIHISDYPEWLNQLELIRVMIVDDSKFLRFKLEKALTAAGLNVVGTAENGRDAVEKSRELTPDVITLDIEMPNYDGISALGPLRELFPDAILIMISSFDEEEKIIEALSKGANSFIEKPIDPLRTVKAIINIIMVERGA